MIIPQKHYTSQISIPAENLPPTLIILKKWALIKCSGNNLIQYLQGQLTCNVQHLTKNLYNCAGYCNPKGKLISNMYVVYLNTYIGCIQRSSICSKQVKIMKKYAIFSKVNINIDYDAALIGFAGKGIRNILSTLFHNLPDEKHNVISYTDNTILHFNLPKERFLIITTKKIQQTLIKKLKNKTQFSSDNQWTTLDIEAEYPLIDYNTSELFLPQETNIQKFHAISFNKGCYIGQEIITRIQSKKIQKRTLYRLFGEISRVPIAGEKLEYKNNEHNKWTKAGTILSACKLNKGIIWIQAILNNPIKKDLQFRLYNSKNDNKIFIYPTLHNN